MQEILIDSEQQKQYCRTWIDECKPDGKKTIVLRNTDTTPTAKQNRLWFKWCREVAQSGLGQDDITEDVHIRAKWAIVRLLLLEQSDLFAKIYYHFMETVKYSENKAEQCIEFARDYISTKNLSKENRTQSLKIFQNYWTRKGVRLTDPSLMGLEKYLRRTK